MSGLETALRPFVVTATLSVLRLLPASPERGNEIPYLLKAAVTARYDSWHCVAKFEVFKNAPTIRSLALTPSPIPQPSRMMAPINDADSKGTMVESYPIPAASSMREWAEKAIDLQTVSGKVENMQEMLQPRRDK